MREELADAVRARLSGGCIAAAPSAYRCVVTSVRGARGACGRGARATPRFRGCSNLQSSVGFLSFSPVPTELYAYDVG